MDNLLEVLLAQSVDNQKLEFRQIKVWGGREGYRGYTPVNPAVPHGHLWPLNISIRLELARNKGGV